MKVFVNKNKKNFFQKKVVSWGKENFENFPWRSTQNKWHAIVAEIMLQRTRADQVLPVYEEFAQKYPYPEDYLKGKDDNIFNKLGLNWREQQLKNLAKFLSENEFPEEKKELLELPGVGEYISSAFISLHLNRRETIIDSNVVRIYGRFFGISVGPEIRRKKWFKEFANEITPVEDFKVFNYGLLDLTRKICNQNPLCRLCCLKEKCPHGIK